VLTWAEFVDAAPDLAAFGARLLTASPAYLATVRSDGAPRVHPVTPIIGPAGLYLFMEPTSPKGRDLRERGRFAMHNGVPDSSGTGGEFRLSGTGRLDDDPAVRGAATAASAYSPADRYILFELLVSEAFANAYGDVELPSPSRWKAQ
jgi:pyridoxamine 5'-phosphate oxidase-like protein